MPPIGILSMLPTMECHRPENAFLLLAHLQPIHFLFHRLHVFNLQFQMVYFLYLHM